MSTPPKPVDFTLADGPLAGQAIRVWPTYSGHCPPRVYACPPLPDRALGAVGPWHEYVLVRDERGLTYVAGRGWIDTPSHGG